MQIRSIAAACAIAGIAAGAGWLPAVLLRPHLVDRCSKDGESRDTAPIVVVGVLTSDTLVRKPIPMHGDHEIPLQLRQLVVRVENVLRGQVADKIMVVYYFTWAGGFNGPRPLGFWGPGTRRVLWLRKDAGVFRTACDGWDYCTMAVDSGAHPRYRADPRKPVDNAVADILLTRGEGRISETRFAMSIEARSPGAEDYLMGKYRRLAMTERPPVKTAACVSLWMWGHDPALIRYASDAMRDADCRCIPISDGNPDCRPAR